MKTLFLILGLSIFSLQSTSAAELKGYDGYVLKPQTGKMRVTVVLLSPKESNQALVYFEGTGSPWDGKAILHKIVSAGKSFRASYAGQEKEIIHIDQYDEITLYPPRYHGDGIAVWQDKDATKNLDLQSVIKKYQP